MSKKVPASFFEATLDHNSQFDNLCLALNLQTTAAKTFLRYALSNTCLMDGKQIDYGSSNISDFGTTGVVIRMNDKFQRIKHLFKKNRKRAVNESILDSFTDIANYAVIAQMLERKEWPSE
jgi:hypothetical protein